MAAATLPIRSESPFWDTDTDPGFNFDPRASLASTPSSLPPTVVSLPMPHLTRQQRKQQQGQGITQRLLLRERRHLRQLCAALERVYAATGYPVEGPPQISTSATVGKRNDVDDALLVYFSGCGSVGAVAAGPGGRPRGEVTGLVVVEEKGGEEEGSDDGASAMAVTVGHVSVQSMVGHGDSTPARLWMEWNWNERGWGTGGGRADGSETEGSGEEEQDGPRSDTFFAEAADLLANTWTLAKLFVDPMAWGRGNGELLVAAAEDLAAAAGKWLVLTVIEKDAGAIRLYERRGWLRFAVGEHVDPSGKVWNQYGYVAPRPGGMYGAREHLPLASCHTILRQHGRWYTSAKE